MSRIRSDYILEVVNGVIVITDLDMGRMSVTNDIENIIEHLKGGDIGITTRPIIYRDSNGIWDGVVVKDGRFDSFIPLGAHTMCEALDKLKRRAS